MAPVRNAHFETQTPDLKRRGWALTNHKPALIGPGPQGAPVQRAPAPSPVARHHLQVTNKGAAGSEGET